ncbi:hypothetical protein V6N13_096785 [Hibiscus sabdariffa]
MRITSPPVPNLNWVSDLIISGTHSWNNELILSTFLVEEAQLILCIPLSRFSQDDCLVWGREHTWLYTVRSGYRLLFGNPSIVHPNSSLFKRLWAI